MIYSIKRFWKTSYYCSCIPMVIKNFFFSIFPLMSAKQIVYYTLFYTHTYKYTNDLQYTLRVDSAILSYFWTWRKFAYWSIFNLYDITKKLPSLCTLRSGKSRSIKITHAYTPYLIIQILHEPPFTVCYKNTTGNDTCSFTLGT